MKFMKSMGYVALLFLCFGRLVWADSEDLPNTAITPGDLMKDANGSPIGRPKVKTSEIRAVTKAEAQAVFEEYHIPLNHRNGTDYEIDHLVSLVLGGSNDIKNLWPQSRDRSKKWNAWEKDKLEAHLMRLVDSGAVPVQEAEQAIATNWIEAYQKYMPLPVPKPNHTSSKTLVSAPVSSFSSWAPQSRQSEGVFQDMSDTDDPDNHIQQHHRKTRHHRHKTAADSNSA